MVYIPELDELFQEDNPNLSVLELEPETFWEKIYPDEDSDRIIYLPNVQAMTRIAALPQQKLVHSVGFPIGGSVSHGSDYIAPLVDAVTTLGAIWASEHLSFNTMQIGGTVQQVGFLLPPRQTSAGVEIAVRNIRHLASQLPVPFAFETGVNYLQPRSDELADGDFFALIADGADCGILLDLHNLWVNEQNGRQPVSEVIEQLPLDRVWEIHLAGGMKLGNYYLDSHSDAIPTPLLDIATQVIPLLPHLGAIVFEVVPGYAEKLGHESVRHQLSLMNDLWRLRLPASISVPCRPIVTAVGSNNHCDIVEWEQILGRLVLGHFETLGVRDEHPLGRDEGVKVLQTLVGEFRDGSIARVMRFTMTLLLIQLGDVAVRTLLDDYRGNSFPDAFASGEADQFAHYLRDRLATLPPVSFLIEVLNFEHALIRAALYGARTRIEWDFDPIPLFEALEAGQIVSPPRATRFSMEIVPER